MAVRCLASKHGVKRPWSECEDSESDEEGVDWERSVAIVDNYSSVTEQRSCIIYGGLLVDERCEIPIIQHAITESRRFIQHRT